MSWLDIVAILVLASSVAIGSERRIIGLVIGLGAVALYRPLLLLADTSPILAGVGAVLLVLIGRRLTPQGRSGVAAQHVVGGFGGLLLGLLAVLALSTSLPVGVTASGTLRYPPDVAQPFTSAVRESRVLEIGRDILFFPLLTQQGYFDASPQLQRQALGGLHEFLTLGVPWEER